MKRIITAISILLASAPLGGMASAALLVENGRPRAEIVIAEEPARMTRLAAEELQTYIEKISGARLPIVTAPSGDAARIYVGISPHTEALGLDTEGLKHGAFRMDSGDGWLALLGPDADFTPVEPWGRERGSTEGNRLNRALDEIAGHPFRNPYHSTYMFHYEDLGVWGLDDRGTLHAVHEFLRDLGVRWYMPGELGEVVPRRDRIAVPAELSRIVRPDFPLRNWEFWSRTHGVTEDDARWRMRQGLHYGRHDILGVPQPVHGMKYVLAREEVQEAHPEYFALVSGERMTQRHGNPCLSSEAVFELHVAYLRAIFDHYDEPMLSIDLVDGMSGRSCRCESCAPLRTPERGASGALSDYVWPYMNRVARALYESHPEKMLLGLAYGSYRLPPRHIERMSPNLAMMMMSPRQYFNNPERRAQFRAKFDQWRRILPSNTFFMYENVHYNWADRVHPMPVYYTHQTAEYLAEYGEYIDGFLYGIYEHRPWLRDEIDWDSLATMHVDLYLSARLWWNRSADVDAMLAEYYARFYGPAEVPMRAFIEFCVEHHHAMARDIDLIDRAFELIAMAESAVAPETIYGRRVDMVVTYLQHMAAQRELLVQERTGPALRVPRRATADLTLDGRLDDDFWSGVPAYALHEVRSGDAPPVDSRVKIAWGDNHSLYIGIRCEEPDMAGVIDTADGGMGVFNGDNIDILLETPIHDFYQLVVSPSGVLLDMDRSAIYAGRFHDGWRSDAQVAVHRGEDYWSAEIQIPAAGADARELDPSHGVSGDAPTDDAPWHINLGRHRPRGADKPAFFALQPSGDQRFNNRFIRASLAAEPRE